MTSFPHFTHTANSHTEHSRTSSSSSSFSPSTLSQDSQPPTLSQSGTTGTGVTAAAEVSLVNSTGALACKMGIQKVSQIYVFVIMRLGLCLNIYTLLL